MAQPVPAPFVAPQAPDLPVMHQALTVVVEEFGHFQNLPAVNNGQNILAAIQQQTEQLNQMNAGFQQQQQQLAVNQQQIQQIQQQLVANQQQVQQQFAATQQQFAVTQQQIQANHQQMSAAVQGLNLRCFLIEETIANGFQELVWETTASRARTLNASTSAVLHRIGPKPGRPAYEDQDWPGIHQRILLLNEESCDRLGLSWGLEFDEDLPLVQKQTLIGQFLGRNMS